MRRLFFVLTILTYASCKPQRNPYAEHGDRPGPGQLQAYVKFSPSDIRQLKTRGYALPVATASPGHSQIPSGFRSTISPPPADNSVAQSHHRRPVFEEENYPVPNSLQVQPRPQQGHRRLSTPQFRQQLEEESKEAILEEEEKEEPDRLSLLLPNSKFDCSGKVTGYYADEGLNCEVFHYCQDNAKHSWICPEGFTFHQVHLICMPPSNENICSKSSQYHFVNDYLYKAINVEEVNSKPNVSLRYSERYYPESYYPSNNDDEEVQQQHIPRKQPIQVGFQQSTQQPQVIAIARQRPQSSQYHTPTLRPETQLYRAAQHGQVFHSPEEVNISLQQRRPYILAQRAYQRRDQENEYK